MIKFILPLFLLIVITPVFAQTYNCPNGCSITVTQNPAPANQPYYQNPQPSNSFFKDIIDIFFNKLGQASNQIGGQNANQIQNVTGGIKNVVDTSIDYVTAIKYLVASLLGIIVPRLFGVDVPWYLLPAIEWTTIILVGIAVWKKAWTIFVISLIIGIVILLLFFIGGVFFH